MTATRPRPPFAAIKSTRTASPLKYADVYRHSASVLALSVCEYPSLSDVMRIEVAPLPVAGPRSLVTDGSKITRIEVAPGEETSLENTELAPALFPPRTPESRLTATLLNGASGRSPCGQSPHAPINCPRSAASTTPSALKSASQPLHFPHESRTWARSAFPTTPSRFMSPRHD